MDSSPTASPNTCRVSLLHVNTYVRTFVGISRLEASPIRSWTVAQLAPGSNRNQLWIKASRGTARTGHPETIMSHTLMLTKQFRDREQNGSGKPDAHVKEFP